VFLQYKIEILFTFLLKKSVKVFVLSQFSVDDNVFRYFLSQEILEVKFFSYFRSREILEVLVPKQLGKNSIKQSPNVMLCKFARFSQA